jgi:hypothetical protein
LALRRQTAHFALWIMAALCAVVMALGPTAASAHPGHEGHATVHRTDHAAQVVANSVTREVSPPSQPALTPKARADTVAVAAFDLPGPALSCHANCCSGVGCCASACIAVNDSTLPLIRPFAIVGLSNVLAIDGTRPDSLLEPPNARA